MHHLDPPPARRRRPIDARSRARSAVVAFGLACFGALAACSGSGEAGPPASSAPSTTRAPRTTTSTTTADRTTTTEVGFASEDDCVSAEDVGAVVGSPVDRRLSLGSTGAEVSYSYEGCVYEIEDSDATVGIVRLSGDGLDGPELYDALEADAAATSDEDGFEEIDDLGDEAYRDGRSLVVRHGPQVLLLGYSPTGDSDERNPDKALRVALAVLPLDLSADPIDCDVVGAALEDEFGAIERTMSGGGIDGVNDATLEYRNCTIVFVDGGEADVGVADAAPFTDWVAGKLDSVFSATFEATSVGELRAFDNGDALFVDDGGKPLRVETNEVDLPDNVAAALRISLAELALGS